MQFLTGPQFQLGTPTIKSLFYEIPLIIIVAYLLLEFLRAFFQLYSEKLVISLEFKYLQLQPFNIRLQLVYDFTQAIYVATELRGTTLMEQAADSPLAESDAFFTGSVMVGYRF